MQASSEKTHWIRETKNEINFAVQQLEIAGLGQAKPSIRIPKDSKSGRFDEIDDYSEFIPRASRIESIDIVVGNSCKKLEFKPTEIPEIDILSGLPFSHEISFYINSSCIEEIHCVALNMGQHCHPSLYTQNLAPFRWSLLCSEKPMRFSIIFMLSDGSKRETTYDVSLSEGVTERRLSYSISNYPRHVHPLQLPGLRFSIELFYFIPFPFNRELDCNPTAVFEYMQSRGLNAQYRMKEIIHKFQPVDVWTLLEERNVGRHPADNYNLGRFQLLSPSLRGGDALENDLHQAMRTISATAATVGCQQDPGFRLFVDVSEISFECLRKICQQFVKYEEVFDLLLTPLEEDDLMSSVSQAKRSIDFSTAPRPQPSILSNSVAIRECLGLGIIPERVKPSGNLNKILNDRIAKCENIEELVAVVSPGKSASYRLDLRRVAEFQLLEFNDGNPCDHPKLALWIRCFFHFLCNSCAAAPPTAFAARRTVEEKMHRMFEWVVKDRYVRDAYCDQVEDSSVRRVRRLQTRELALRSAAAVATRHVTPRAKRRVSQEDMAIPTAGADLHDSDWNMETLSVAGSDFRA